MPRPPEVVTLAALRKEAKRRLKALRAADPAEIARFSALLPGVALPPGLRQVQRALARERGFASWLELKDHVELGALQRTGAARLHDEFLEAACIFTFVSPDFPRKWRRAGRILEHDPAIARASIHAAALSGELDHVRALLERDGDRVREKGGAQGWEPLLFVCYGRVPTARAADNAVAIAELLLDHGADPDSCFVTPDDWRLRFTALTGAMGKGELGQPEHPRAEALARLLLSRGANANDSQGLYNTCLEGDETRWLELLFSYGLGPRDPIAWHADPADAHRSGADRGGSMLDYLLVAAIKFGHVRRARRLLEHGADPDARSIYDGRSCLQTALVAGRRDLADLLLRHGARDQALDGLDAFVAACSFGDRSTARRLAARHPEFLRSPEPLLDAAEAGRVDAVRLLLELGMDPAAEGRHGRRSLHAGWRHRDVCELLIAHGADPRARSLGATVADFAKHGGDLETARWHARASGSLLDAVTTGDDALAAELLAADPTCVSERDLAGGGPLHALPADPAAAETLIARLLAAGADPRLRDDAGKTAAERLEADGLDEIADLLEAASSC